MTTTKPAAKGTAGVKNAGQPVHFIPPKNHRFLLLDALRGIAALIVVVFHIPSPAKAAIAGNGFLAVDFFFCLSGFVIAFSYEKRLAESLSLRDFFVARVIRLYPVYLLGAMIGLLVLIPTYHFALHANRPWSSWASLFALALLLWPTRLSTVPGTTNFPLNNPAWSLFYEMVANLAYALLIKLRAAGNIILGLIAGLSFAVLANAVLRGGSLDVGNERITLGLGFARVAFSFSIGVLIFRLYRSRLHKTEEGTSHWAPAVIVTIGVVGILTSPLAGMISGAFRLVAVGVLFPALVYFGAMVRLPHRFAKVSSVLGELSYPLYLLHWPLVAPLLARRVQQIFAAHAALVPGIVLTLLAVFAAIAWWIGEHVDLPIRRALTKHYNLIKANREVAANR